MKFSVVTTSFNQGEFIRQTIESVQQQGTNDFEHIVVDGGSTDNTVEILKQYPHLQWTSGPDDGQTDALNKGLRRCTGDIIVWLNSDDWLPPNVFPEIATALETYPVLVGECEITDRMGNTTYRVPNVSRTWFDMLKHWCPYSIPTQPSIFFKRSVLEEFRLPDGNFLDNELDFCMDFELWLRIFSKYEFKKLDRVLSYYRMYETNKTGGTGGLEPHKPEMSRIFRRHELRGLPNEHAFSFIIPVNRLSNDLSRTLQSIANQQSKDFEIIVVDYSSSSTESKEIKRNIREMSKSWFAVRYARSKTPTLSAALNTGSEVSCARYVAFTEPGADFVPEYLTGCAELLERDNIGIVLPFGERDELLQLFLNDSGQLKLDGLLSCPRIPFNFVARRSLLLDLAGCGSSPNDLYTLRRLLLRTLYKGWNMAVDRSLVVYGDFLTYSLEQTENNALNARLVVELEAEYQTDPFAAVRAEHQCTIRFPEELVAECKNILANHSNEGSPRLGR